MKTPKINLINRQKQPLKRVRLLDWLKKLSKLEPLSLSEINVVVVDESEMKDLNECFLKHLGPTDVITFQHGEIIVCYNIAQKESQKRRITFNEELLRYIVHGWLHLRGYSDKKPRESKTMLNRQEAILSQLGLPPHSIKKKI